MTDIENRLSILEKKLGLAGNDILDTELRIEALEKKLLSEENGDVSIIVSKDSEGNKVKYNIVDATAVNRLKSYVDANLKPEIFKPLIEGIDANTTEISKIIKEVYGQEKITDSESRIDYIEKILSNVINTLAYETSIRIESKYLLGSSDYTDPNTTPGSSSSNIDSSVMERINELESRLIILEESKAVIKINQKLEELKEKVEAIDISTVNSRIDTEVSLLEDEITKFFNEYCANKLAVAADTAKINSNINDLTETLKSLESFDKAISASYDNITALVESNNNNAIAQINSLDSMLQLQFVTLSDSIEDLDAKADSLSKKLDDDNKDLQTKISDLETTVKEDLSNSNKELQNKISDLEVTVKGDFSNSNKEFQTKINDLEAAIKTDLFNSNKDLQTKISTLEDISQIQIETLGNSFSDINNKIDIVEAEFKNKNTAIDDYIAVLENAFGSKVSELETKIQDLNNYILILEEKIDSLESKDIDSSASI